jgi:hypothetical protein
MSLRSAPSVILSAAKNLCEAISNVAREGGKIHRFTETAARGGPEPFGSAQGKLREGSRYASSFACAQDGAKRAQLRSADFAQDDNNQSAGLARPARALLAPATVF